MSLERQLGRMVDQGLPVAAAMDVLVAKGLEFSDVVDAFARLRDADELAFVDAAQALVGDDAESTVPANAVVAPPVNGGRHVMAWVWVENDDVPGWSGRDGD